MKSFVTFFIFLSFCNFSYAETETITDLENNKISDNGHFTVSYTSKLDPIEINNLHSWIVHIKDKNGKDIPTAKVNVNGGMPAHNHGLPTQPQITKNLGNGCYLLEGMKFHMLGKWVVTITIKNENISDAVTFNLTL